MKIKVDIFSGFLGAGKTKLIKKQTSIYIVHTTGRNKGDYSLQVKLISSKRSSGGEKRCNQVCYSVA